MRKVSLVIFLFTAIVVQLSGQTPSPMVKPGEESTPRNLTIKGKIVEATNHTPMEFAILTFCWNLTQPILEVNHSEPILGQSITVEQAIICL